MTAGIAHHKIKGGKKKKMNKIVGLVVIALVATSIGVAVYASVYSSTPEQELNSLSIRNEMGGFHNTPEEYVLNTALPSVPDKLMVYKVVTNVSEVEAASLAERLGLNGSIKETSDGEAFALRDGSQHHLLILKISGKVSYTNTSKTPEWVVESERDRPEGVPSDEEAVEIATKFLNDKGLMPEDAVLRKVVPRTPLIFIPDYNGKKEMVTLWKGVEVWFGREISGFPVTGCGAKMSVEIDGYGNVKDIYKLWRECEPYKEYSIITPEEAFEEFKRKGVDVRLRNVSTATINKVYLAYYSKCAGEEQTYLKPVYVFEGKAKGERGGYNETMHFVQHIAALQSFEE